MLQEKLNGEQVAKEAEPSSICAGGDPSNAKKLASKRYSIDHYCSSWLTSSASTSSDAQPADQYNEVDRVGQKYAAAYQHRRSLSENIIPFPPHTTPSDKARCHLLNRSKINTNRSCSNSGGSSTRSSNSSIHDVDDSSNELFTRTTLRKVAETMFLKDPQYKPPANDRSCVNLNPFAALTQLKGVKKIIGANPALYSSGACDLFSSCFEISMPFSKELSSLNEGDDGMDHTQVKSQAKSLPNSPKISQRKMCKVEKMTSLKSEKKSKSIASDAGSKSLKENRIEAAPSGRAGALEKKNPNSLFNHPLFSNKSSEAKATTSGENEGSGSNVENCFFDNPKVLTRGGSSESGFFSCLTDEDSNRPAASHSLCPSECDPHPSGIEQRSLLSSLRSFDDFDLFERHRNLEGNINDSMSIDMGLVNRLSLDSEINHLFHKNHLSNHYLYCKNRTSSVYTDSSEDISSLAGSDSLLWDDRMSSYRTSIPNTRSAQIAKIVEYFERKGQNFKSTASAMSSANAFSRNRLSSSIASTSSNFCSSASPREFLPYENCIPAGVRHTDAKPIDFKTAYHTTSKEYEAFCLDLDRPQRLTVCDGVVKSKLQLFDKLRNNNNCNKWK